MASFPSWLGCPAQTLPTYSCLLFQSFQLPGDAHLGGAFDAQLQDCLAFLQWEAPDGLDLLELGQAGGLWGRKGALQTIPLLGSGRTGGGAARKN